MTKTKKVIPRINQVFAMLVKSKESQVAVANDLGISSQSVGYYMRGRKIPFDVIEKWEATYGQDLKALTKTDFETNIETIVSRETENFKHKIQEVEKNATFNDSGSDLQKALLESLKGINKLLDENSQLIKDKREEVARLDRQNTWASAQIDKLTSKLGIPKDG